MRSISNRQSDRFSRVFLLGCCGAIVAQLFIVLPARADCVFEGKTYETGETVGPYVCMPDGKWQ